MLLTDRTCSLYLAPHSSQQLLHMLNAFDDVLLPDAGPRLPHQLLMADLRQAHQLPGSGRLEARLEL